MSYQVSNVGSAYASAQTCAQRRRCTVCEAHGSKSDKSLPGSKTWRFVALASLDPSDLWKRSIISPLQSTTAPNLLPPLSGHEIRPLSLHETFKISGLIRGSQIVMSSSETRDPRLACSTPISFLDLPRGVRNNIYERLLVLRHPVYIFQEPNSPIESFAPDRPFRWLALLHTSRQIYTESSAVLYGMNQFHLEDITPLQADLLQSFLDCIGPMNAASLSHLCVNFPVAERINDQAERIELRADSLQSVRLYQDQCTKLSTLELVVHYKNSSFFREPNPFLREALSLIDAQLRAIPSLRQIVVRFVDFNGIPTTLAGDFMRELGWTVVLRNGVQY